MNRALQNKKQEEEFWNKVSKQRVYAAFDEDEYEDCFDWSIGKRQNKKTYNQLNKPTWKLNKSIASK